MSVHGSVVWLDLSTFTVCDGAPAEILPICCASLAILVLAAGIGVNLRFSHLFSAAATLHLGFLGTCLCLQIFFRGSFPLFWLGLCFLSLLLGLDRSGGYRLFLPVLLLLQLSAFGWDRLRFLNLLGSLFWCLGLLLHCCIGYLCFLHQLFTHDDFFADRIKFLQVRPDIEEILLDFEQDSSVVLFVVRLELSPDQLKRLIQLEHHKFHFKLLG